ncbi:hypothetical protein FIC_01167 [Flavobacteriaceae bacterium 3519-10]|nr:hypothetical protein FIC_01167 [Flavobacteriaceae bacterium 3519-10]
MRHVKFAVVCVVLFIHKNELSKMLPKTAGNA